MRRLLCYCRDLHRRPGLGFFLARRYHSQRDKIDVLTFGGARSITRKYFSGRVGGWGSRSALYTILACCCLSGEVGVAGEALRFWRCLGDSLEVWRFFVFGLISLSSPLLSRSVLVLEYHSASMWTRVMLQAPAACSAVPWSC